VPDTTAVHPDAEPVSPRATEVQHDSGAFAGGVLSTGEVLAQSIANIAPTYGAALTIALVYGTAGHGAWLTWALATGIFLIVGMCVVGFAKRYASAGSLYSFVSVGIGPLPAFVVGAGWIAIVATGPVLVMVLGNYALATLNELNIGGGGGVRLAVYLIGTGTAAFVSFRGIQISTKLLLLLELSSMTIIVVLLLIVVLGKGTPFDTAQLSLRGTTFTDVFKGVILAAFAFGGFESAASLGFEARNPHRQVPRAVLGSALIVGLFFVLNAYGQDYGFAGRPGQLQNASAPLSDLANFAGIGGLRIVIDISIVLSAWSCMVANFNHGSRMLYTLGKDRVLPRVFDRSHPRYLTPHVAVETFAVVWSVFLILIVVTAGNVTNWINWLGTFQGYIYILGYILIGIAAAVAALRVASRSRGQVVFGLGATASLLVVLEQSVIPLPTYPFNFVFFAFLAYVILAGAYYALRAQRDSALPDRVRANARRGQG
jgi:amino acid transporter